jgi:hypothetical protein
MKFDKNKNSITKKNNSIQNKSFKLVEHNILEKTHLLTLNKITNTLKFKKLFNLFIYTGLLLYYIFNNSNNTISGYVFIGKIDNNKYTITITFLSNSISSYKVTNLLKLLIQKLNKLFNKIFNGGYQLDENNIKIDSDTFMYILKKHPLLNLSKFANPHILEEYDKYYILSARKINSLMFTRLEWVMEEYGVNETIDARKKPLLLWIEILENYKFASKYFNTECWLMNVLDDSKIFISNKSNLYNNFQKYSSRDCYKYMAQTWNFKINTKQFYNRIINNNDVFIVRPAGIGAFSGKGIIVVHDKKSFNKAVEESKNYETVIISKYITNPLLLQRRKFHLRTYLLVGVINGQYVTKFLDFYELYTALEPYKNMEYNNHDIHDTHFGSTSRDYICPDDLPNDMKLIFNTHIYPKMQHCMLLISKMFEKHAKPWLQAANAFEFFGCDFLVHDDYNITLLEINDRIGFKKYSTEKRLQFSNLVCNVILDSFLLPLLINKPIPSNWWLYQSHTTQHKKTTIV